MKQNLEITQPKKKIHEAKFRNQLLELVKGTQPPIDNNMKTNSERKFSEPKSRIINVLTSVPRFNMN